MRRRFSSGAGSTGTSVYWSVSLMERLVRGGRTASSITTTERRPWFADGHDGTATARFARSTANSQRTHSESSGSRDRARQTGPHVRHLSGSCHPSLLLRCVLCPAPPMRSVSPSGPQVPCRDNSVSTGRRSRRMASPAMSARRSWCRTAAGRRSSRSASVTSPRRRRCATRRRRSPGPPASAPTSPPTSPRPTASMPPPLRTRRHRGRAARRLPVPRSEVGQVGGEQARDALAGGRPIRRARRAARGIAQGVVTSEAANLARELANTPANLLTARAFAARRSSSPATRGLAAEVFDQRPARAMGCGGMLGVNAGSVEPPRMVKLTYTPRNPRRTSRSSARA